MTDILDNTSEGVLTITLNRPTRKNALTQAMYERLAELLQQADNDALVRCTIIQGDANAFSAGNDIADFVNIPTAQGDPPSFRFMRAIATFSKPLVAAVCGPAVGIGTTLLFHCDIVIAGENAAFALPFVNLGVCPEAGSSLLAPTEFGYHRAAEAFLLGEAFPAQKAQELGLVSRVLPAAQVLPAARELADRLAAKPLTALVETKRLLKSGSTPAVLERIETEGKSFLRLVGEPAAKEAFAAFMEKRKPNVEHFR
jgi:enoyl-CoA hydratase/carnithine racemase